MLGANPPVTISPTPPRARSAKYAVSRWKCFGSSSRPVCIEPISTRLRSVVKPRSSGASRCGYALFMILVVGLRPVVRSGIISSRRFRCPNSRVLEPMSLPRHDGIRIRGARQNNLRNLDLDLPLGELIVVTGVSRLGQVLARLRHALRRGPAALRRDLLALRAAVPRPHGQAAGRRIDGIPPAIAIDQTNPVRTSRSTVGTMTELNDHLKLLYARAARAALPRLRRPVRRDTPETDRRGAARAPRRRATRGSSSRFRSRCRQLQGGGGAAAARAAGLHAHPRARQGRRSKWCRTASGPAARSASRLIEALEAALRVGRGQGQRVAVGGARAPTCASPPTCTAPTATSPTPSPRRARSRSTRRSAPARPAAASAARSASTTAWSCPTREDAARRRDQAVADRAFRECQDDMEQVREEARRAAGRAVARSRDEQRAGCSKAKASGKTAVWYGVRRFFAWLEDQELQDAHPRAAVEVPRYTPCAACDGARLKPDALLWRLGAAERDASAGSTSTTLDAAAGRAAAAVLRRARLPAPLDEATALLLAEIRARLGFLVRGRAGLSRRSTASRARSPAARCSASTSPPRSAPRWSTRCSCSTSPRIGLHPRDMGRVIDVMRAAARRRQHAGGGRARPADHAGRRPPARHGPGPGRARRRDRVLRPAGARSSARGLAHRRIPARPQGRAERGRAAVRREPGGPCLELLGASEHNLKHIDVRSRSGAWSA